MSKLYTVNGRECNNPDGVAVKVTLPNGEEEVLYDPHPKQLEFHGRNEANVLMYGGRGSGKSVALRWEAHMRAMSTPGFYYCILRRTYPELAKTHLNFVSWEMDKLGGSFNKSERIAYYPNGSKGFFSHCAGEEDVLNLLGSQFYWMGFDELSTFDWEMFQKLATSVRVPVGSGLTAMVRACTNPLGPSAEEINKYFVEKDVDPEEDQDYIGEDWYCVKANIEDNPSLDRDQYMKRFASQPEHIKKAWVEGDFSFEAALFDVHPTKVCWVGDPPVQKKIPYHYINEINLRSLVANATIYRAVDLGWFPDPTYILWIAHLGNRYVCFHEKILYKTIARDIAAIIHEEDEKLGVSRVAMTYIDPTATVHTTVDVYTNKDILEANGVPVEPSINDRWLFPSAIHAALGQEAGPNLPRIQIFTGNKTLGCPYLAKTLTKQRYDLKDPLKMADQSNDHAAVTLAYFLISSSSIDQRPVQRQSQMRPWQRDKSLRVVLGRENVK